MRSLRLLLASLLLVSCASLARAQPPALVSPAANGDAGVEAEESVARDSPRASILDFLTLCRAGDYEQAAEYLELTQAQQPLGPTLARKLKAVLDRKAWVELDALSPDSSGNTQDGLPTWTDELARIEGAEGVLEPVRIVRRRRDGNVRWMFSATTVSRIDGWYERLKDRWMLEHLPARLLRPGPRELMWWQWLALPMLLGLGWAVGMALSLLTTKILAKVASHTTTTWDDLMVERLKRPLTLWWALGVTYSFLPSLALYKPAEEFVLRAMQAVFLVGFFWGLSRIIDIGAQAVFRAPWASGREASHSLISLGARVAKVAVLAIGVVALLSQLGYPVASILAGLGVGGLAVALAAQKTLENLFGAFSIGADQPFREGDFVRVNDFVGTVELIGLRSTKFRTLERTLISIPNGKLADMKLETFAARDRMRLMTNIGLVYTTTSAQLRTILTSIEQLLKNHPKYFPDSASVRFIGFADSSLTLEVVAMIATRDWNEFTLIRQDLYLECIRIIEQAGSAIAFPTRTVQLLPRDASAPRPEAHDPDPSG